MVVTRTCATGTHIAVAKAVSPVEITEDTVRVLKSASGSEPIEDAAVCEISITAAMLSYSFSEDGEHLILTDPGGNPDYLELARDTKADDTWLYPSALTAHGCCHRLRARKCEYKSAGCSKDGQRQDRVRQIAVCSRDQSLVSHVDSDISVNKDLIKVTQSASNQQQEGSFICKASILATTWRYAISPSGLNLTLYAEGAKPLILTREKQPGLN